MPDRVKVLVAELASGVQQHAADLDKASSGPQGVASEGARHALADTPDPRRRNRPHHRLMSQPTVALQQVQVGGGAPLGSQTALKHAGVGGRELLLLDRRRGQPSEDQDLAQIGVPPKWLKGVPVDALQLQRGSSKRPAEPTPAGGASATANAAIHGVERGQVNGKAVPAARRLPDLHRPTPSLGIGECSYRIEVGKGEGHERPALGRGGEAPGSQPPSLPQLPAIQAMHLSPIEPNRPNIAREQALSLVLASKASAQGGRPVGPPLCFGPARPWSPKGNQSEYQKPIHLVIETDMNSIGFLKGSCFRLSAEEGSLTQESDFWAA